MLGAAGAGKAFSVSSDIFKAVLAAAGQAAWQRSVNPTQPAVLGAKPWCSEGSSPAVAFIRTSRASSALPACWGLDQEEGRLNKAFFLVFFLSSNVHSRCQQVLRCPGWTGAARLHRLHQCKSAARVSSAAVTSW